MSSLKGIDSFLLKKKCLEALRGNGAHNDQTLLIHLLVSLVYVLTLLRQPLGKIFG